MEVGRSYDRPAERLNSTLPILSRVIIGPNSRSIAPQHHQPPNPPQSPIQLAARLKVQCQQTDRLKKTILTLQQRIFTLQKQLRSTKSQSQQRSQQQMKLVRVQDRTNNLIRKLQSQISLKTAQIQEKSGWELRYHELSQYMHIYTGEIALMQEEFKAQYVQLTGQLRVLREQVREEVLNRENAENQYHQLIISKQKLQMQLETVKGDLGELLKASRELEEENEGLLKNGRAVGEELSRCTQMVEKLFAEVKAKEEELAEKDRKVGYLEGSLKDSVEEIERLNQIIRNTIQTDSRAIEQIQRLDKKYAQTKSCLQSCKLQSQQKSHQILQLQSQIKSLLQTTQALKQLTRDLQSKLVTSLANQQHLRSTQHHLRSTIQTLQLKLSQTQPPNPQPASPNRITTLQQQILQLKTEMQQDAEAYQKELLNCQRTIQQLEKYKKQSQTKSLLLGSMKEKMKDEKGRGGEFRLGEFQMRLERYSRSSLKEDEQEEESGFRTPEKMFARARTSQDTAENLKRIVDNISSKVNELSGMEQALKLRTDLLPSKVQELSDEDYSN